MQGSREPGGKTFVQKTLVAFDTDRIKSYVFGTDKLKEVRGASALLDKLNRKTMRKEARSFKDAQIHPIYTNGGQGLFVVIADNANQIATGFGKRVQKEFMQTTRGGASVTYVIQPLPDDLPDEIGALKGWDLSTYFSLLRIQMEITKGTPSDTIALPSHPLLRQCDACGIRYAEEKVIENDKPDDQFYCLSCREKQKEDGRIKESLPEILKQASKIDQNKKNIPNEELWERITFYLTKAGYTFGEQFTPERPNDFDAFRPFTEAKEYIGLIYADANNMGAKMDHLKTLTAHEEFAMDVDQAIHEAMSCAIKKHLPIVQVSAQDDAEDRWYEKDRKQGTLFPFDIFLVGGDDIVMLTDAAKAMDVALTIAQEFREITKQEHTLSIGVVLAPIKYPFSLMRGLVEEVLNDAKKASAKAREKAREEGIKDIDDTRINFRIVNGGMQINTNNPYYKKVLKTMNKAQQEFYATLRPYPAEGLSELLQTIKEGQRLNLGRTKLHQMREAILKMNITTSVSDCIAVLRNWNEKQLKHIINYHNKKSMQYQPPTNSADNPVAGLPRLLFPWFLEGDGQAVYRTPLLDLGELYDFVARDKNDHGTKGEQE
jgi:hypothetical protein